MSGQMVDPGAPLPDREEDIVDVAAVVDLLGAAGVPSCSVGTGGGCITVYVGDGDWDEAAERWTQPLSIGPCHLAVGPATRVTGARLAGLVGELSYGDREDGEIVYEPTAPDVIAAALIAAYQSEVAKQVAAYRGEAGTPAAPQPAGGSQLREMWPEGRVLFYEGAEPERFRAHMKSAHGFDPAEGREQFDAYVAANYGGPWPEGPFSEEHAYAFWCPPERLDEVYGSGRYPIGT